MSNLIGKKVTITAKDSLYYDDWGIIKYFDGEYYYVAIANSSDEQVVFERDEFVVHRNKNF